MSPSNLEMKVGTIKNYNNEIVLSTNDQELWWNKTANLPANATSYTDVSGTPTRKANPGPKIPLAAQGKPIMGALGRPMTIPTEKQAQKVYKTKHEAITNVTTDSHQQSLIKPDSHQIPKKPDQHSVLSSTTQKTVAEHENHKTALIVRSIVLGLVALLIYESY